MASLHAIESNQLKPAYSQLNFENFKNINGLAEQPDTKWTYLIANNIRFSENLEHAIRLPKPKKDALYVWLEKLVVAEQCSMLFVEDLDFNDPRTVIIRHACETHGVALVNLTIDSYVPDNLILGPWH